MVYLQCGVYFLTYLVDGTLGLVLVIAFIRAVRACAVKFAIQDLMDSGYYGEPPRWRVWWKQLGSYLLALLLMKLVNSLLIWTLYTPLVSASNALFAGFASHRHLELVLVMIILPGVCNSFQFWVRSLSGDPRPGCMEIGWLAANVCDGSCCELDTRLAYQVLGGSLAVLRAAGDERREASHVSSFLQQRARQHCTADLQFVGWWRRVWLWWRPAVFSKWWCGAE